MSPIEEELQRAAEAAEAPPPDDGEPVEFTLGGRPDCVGLGLTVKRQARAEGWPELDCAEIALLVIELCTNAVNHGGGGTCRVLVTAREVRIEVEDQGPGFPDWVLENAPRPRTRGLGAGIACVRRLAHLLRFENPPRGGARAVAARYRLKTPATPE